MITIIDYGMGNLRSVSKALESLGAEVRITSDPHEIARAPKLILPGVGAFPAAMRELTVRGLIEPITASIARGTPYLGLCLGLQLLFEVSEEGSGAKGLGVLPGRVRRFQLNGHPELKVPHMGWNQVRETSKVTSQQSQVGSRRPERCPLLQGIADEAFVYFVHSYYVEPADPGVIVLETDYGMSFTSMVWRDRLFATQFHPEKSQAVGLQLLQNFINVSES